MPKRAREETMAATIKSSVRLFGGVLQRLTHTSKACKCDMTFAVYMPPQAEAKKVPVLYWLSGLTCTDENFSQKSGFARAAAERGVAVVIPDTSPRGVTIEGADDSYDFGSGAGFYVDATQAPWSEHYHMYTYVTSELPALVASTFDGKVSASKAISGHSMGGHGAITLALKNPGAYASVSAFSPICHPTNCPWGTKAFEGYLGSVEAGEAHDATLLVQKYTGPPVKLLVDQGSADNFLVGDVNQLQPDALQAACLASKGTVELTYRLQGGYDHSYYFISSFIADHIHYHADAMGA
jgi:S-formylglutathione hydrolase